MSYKPQFGSRRITIHKGNTVLLTELDGGISWPGDNGLYFFDTRLISSWAVYSNGKKWILLNGGTINYYAAQIYMINKDFHTEIGPVPARTLGLVLSRSIDGGMHDDLDLTNYGSTFVRFQLELAIRSDFADAIEVKRRTNFHRPRIMSTWSCEQQELNTTYKNHDFVRRISVKVRPADLNLMYSNGRLNFEIALHPRESWHCCLLYRLADGDQQAEPLDACFPQLQPFEHLKRSHRKNSRMKLQTCNINMSRMFRQALTDMESLRLHVGGTRNMVSLPAAGVPWYVTVFGRDSLIASMQCLLTYPEYARGTLEVLGLFQADETDEYRDSEPGKIMHEMRYGELAHLKKVPYTPYYGTADATPVYLILLHKTWMCTGDREMLERHLKTAERCLAWIDEYGDSDGDGFQEYETRSSVGYENMGWKDSPDSVVYPDGSPVRGPKALCELQGYVYDAWLRMAEVYDYLERPDQAHQLREKALALYMKFNIDFWDENFGCYAYALDGDKKKVLTLASNVGHCLWSGIVAPYRAESVVARLMRPDMSSGWGIRTLSSLHPAFNPHNYQTGSIWPHDNSLIAIGFKRYGFAREAAQIAHDICEASSHFQLNQLPELYAGIQRRGLSAPVQYFDASVPQAWSAGSAFTLLDALLGFEPDAPHGRLYIDPYLPSWMSDLTVTNLTIGDQSLDIHCWSDQRETHFEVVRGNSHAVMHRSSTEARRLLMLGSIRSEGS